MSSSLCVLIYCIIANQIMCVLCAFLFNQGKGRTLAGFVVENIARGRNKHVWVSVSSDLYEDAKRDLSDLGMETYAEQNCFNLGKLPYGSLSSTSAKGKGKGKKGKGKKGKKRKNDEINGDPYAEGVMFSTYSTLVAKKTASNTRLEQLIQCKFVSWSCRHEVVIIHQPHLTRLFPSYRPFPLLFL